MIVIKKGDVVRMGVRSTLFGSNRKPRDVDDPFWEIYRWEDDGGRNPGTG